MLMPIISAKFYGNSLNGINDVDKKIEKNRKQQPSHPEYRRRSLFQPSRHKEEFWKQSEAIANAAEYSNDDDILCSFVFQDENERRRFIVTYPGDFWEDCKHVPSERRVFYEVIPQHCPCFLYYDIEFETDLNKEKNGILMTSTLIEITIEYIAKYWNYHCAKNMVINLDSSRDGKFSKHLIFSTKDVAFKNNIEVGALVKMICLDIIQFVSNPIINHNILSKFSKESLEELFVETNKGKKIFIDLNVYSKNRHFRIYKATKWGKNSHLLHASDCKCNWNKKSTKNNDLNIFINSLISYLPKKKKLKFLSFDEKVITTHKLSTLQIHQYSQHAKINSKPVISKLYSKSSYLALNKFMSDFIKPGRIRDIKQIDNNHFIFETVGNRYCENIGRWHKSNNVYFIVDVNNKVMYQKCHDQDCNTFVSTPKKLPVEVIFYFEDETDSLFFTLKD